MKPLGRREREILVAVANGVPHKNIGNKATVTNQLYKIRQKLRAVSTPNAVAIAMKEGIIKMEEIR